MAKRVGSSIVIRFSASDHSGPKGDRRHVPFARRPQTDDKPARPFLEPFLIGMPDHRGVEERRRLERIFLREKRADQELPLFGQAVVGEEQMADALKPALEEDPRALVAAQELAHHLVEEPVHLRLGEGHHARNDLERPILADRPEWPDHDTRVRWNKSDPGPFHIHVRTLGRVIKGRASCPSEMAVTLRPEGQARCKPRCSP